MAGTMQHGHWQESRGAKSERERYDRMLLRDHMFLAVCLRSKPG